MLTTILCEILLAGTIVAGPNSVATIRTSVGCEEGKTSCVKSFREGQYHDGWQFRRIMRDEVVIGSPTLERLLRAGDYQAAEVLTRGIDVQGDHITFSPEAYRYVTETSLPTIVNEATATRIADGWIIWNFDKGSVYDLIGLEENDLVQAIDGQPLTTPARSLDLLTEAKGKRAFAVTLKRRGETRTLRVEVR